MAGGVARRTICRQTQGAGCSFSKVTSSGLKGKRPVISNFDPHKIYAHRQLYRLSCIPSAVEMVLKLTGCAVKDFYDLQKQWENRPDGSLGAFDGRVISGLRFKHLFTMPRGKN